MFLPDSLFKKTCTLAVVLVPMLIFFTPVSFAQSNSSAQEIINALRVQVADLQKEVARQADGNYQPQDSYVWKRNLSLGDKGEDVRKLQKFLNFDPATRVSVYGAGAPGFETDYYGPATMRAVQRFQEKYKAEVLSPENLSQGSGYFGALSRGKIKTLQKKEETTQRYSSDEKNTSSDDIVISYVAKKEETILAPPKKVSKVLSTSPPRTAGAPVCNASKMKEILAPATDQKRTVGLKCSPRLKKGDVITKQVVIEKNNASNVVLNCNGATLDGSAGTVNYGQDMILVRSKKVAGAWSRPEDVTIRNCTVKGGMRVYGMGITGANKNVQNSSFSLGHTERQQAAAPTRLTIENVTFIAQNRIPLFLSPGVTYTTVRNVTFAGRSNSTSVYLAAESAHNTFENNNFTINPKGTREVFAIDGSAYNVIKNNKFSGLNKGGIFLYRNCGESGTVRHQKPQYNEITGNEFYYNKYRGGLPAIWLGSRTGNARRYCGDDAGYPFGSSIDNGSFAENNTVTGNKIVKLSASKMIRNSNPPNTIEGNGTIAKRGDSLPGPKTVTPTTVARTMCPKYQKPLCGVGEVVQVGEVDANGCATAPACVMDARKSTVRAYAPTEENITENTPVTNIKVSSDSSDKNILTVGAQVVTNNPHTTKRRLNVFFSGLRGIGKGVHGEIVSGPGHYGGNVWWQVEYENGLTAWSRADRITVVEAKVLGVSISRDPYVQLKHGLAQLQEILHTLQ